MLRLGTVTYNIAKDWDLDTILTTLPEVGFEGVELRTTHAHGVEVSLTDSERAEVRKRFEDSPIELVGLGTRLRVSLGRSGRGPSQHRRDQGIHPAGP